MKYSLPKKKNRGVNVAQNGLGNSIEKRKGYRKRVLEDRDEVIVEVCMSVDKIGRDVGIMKDDISGIRTDVSGIKGQITGLTDLLTDHVEHHPKLRMRPRVPPSVKERIIESRTTIVAAVITGFFTFLAAYVAIKGV